MVVHMAFCEGHVNDFSIGVSPKPDARQTNGRSHAKLLGHGQHWPAREHRSHSPF
jgi:hypothetical protein